MVSILQIISLFCLFRSITCAPLPLMVTRMHTANPVTVTDTYTTNTKTVTAPMVEIFISNGDRYTFTLSSDLTSTQTRTVVYTEGYGTTTLAPGVEYTPPTATPTPTTAAPAGTTKNQVPAATTNVPATGVDTTNDPATTNVPEATTSAQTTNAAPADSSNGSGSGSSGSEDSSNSSGSSDNSSGSSNDSSSGANGSSGSPDSSNDSGSSENSSSSGSGSSSNESSGNDSSNQGNQGSQPEQSTQSTDAPTTQAPTTQTTQAPTTQDQNTPAPTTQDQTTETQATQTSENDQTTTSATSTPASTIIPSGIVYSPYNNDGTCKDSGSVQSDLELIKSKGIPLVRIYGNDCNYLETVLPVCQSLGLKVNQGFWIGSSGVDSIDDAVDGLIQYASESGWDVFEYLTIGNEAIISQFCSVSDLINKISSVKSKLEAAGYTGKVTTAEPPVIFQRSPELCNSASIDFVSINSHSYFDPNSSAESSGSFVKNQKEMIEGICSGMEIQITETGYPSQGDTYGGNVPSVENQRLAIANILEETNGKVTILTLYNDYWKNPGPYGIEQSFGIIDLLQ